MPRLCAVLSKGLAEPASMLTQSITDTAQFSLCPLSVLVRVLGGCLTRVGDVIWLASTADDASHWLCAPGICRDHQIAFNSDIQMTFSSGHL